MEFIFFIAHPVVACLRLVTKAVLITHPWFSYCWIVLVTATRTLLFTLSASLQARRLGVGKMQRGDTAGTGEPNWPKGYYTSYNVMLSNKTGGWSFRRRALVCGKWLSLYHLGFFTLFILHSWTYIYLKLWSFFFFSSFALVILSPKLWGVTSKWLVSA